MKLKISMLGALLVMAGVLLAGLSACGAYGTPPAATPAPTYTINTMTKAGIGNYLVDGKGMSLYYFTRDAAGKSNASAAVIANWPIFYTASVVVPASLKGADFGAITRDDGQMQATFKGWPLYYYVKDLAVGDTLGQAVNNVWFVVNPDIFSPQTATSSTPPPTPPTPPANTPTIPTPPVTPPPPVPAPAPSVTVSLVARSFAFDKSTISVAAGAEVTINFDNQDSAPHNFALYKTSAAQDKIFVGTIITGPATTTYKFTAPTEAGSYFFRCDIHPNMKGTFVVAP